MKNVVNISKDMIGIYSFIVYVDEIDLTGIIVQREILNIPNKITFTLEDYYLGPRAEFLAWAYSNVAASNNLHISPYDTVYAYDTVEVYGAVIDGIKFIGALYKPNLALNHNFQLKMIDVETGNSFITSSNKFVEIDLKDTPKDIQTSGEILDISDFQS